MAETAAVAALVVLGLLTVFQVLLVAGAPLGRYAWGGGHEVLPRGLRVGSAVAVGIYAVIALVLLDRSGLTAMLPGRFVDVGVWVAFAYVVIGIGMNAISRSRREALVMTPTCLVLAGLTFLVATGA
ncbi:hypothetical protein [Cellulomonas hominis]|uniref:hypothetical protein n=1 Tax=Cellulomonas hominis TaxID=156981 RepID=UPI001BA376A0|nr:hypothetical protein [Cellulomonas hominis]VTR77005.1 hypothetical protein CHMI_01773 [Cellulomonas hominis]